MGSWGGAAGGPRPQFQNGNKAGVKISAERRAQLEARANEYFDDLDEIARDPSHPQRINAIQVVHNRLWGQPKAETENKTEQTIIVKTGVPRADRD